MLRRIAVVCFALGFVLHGRAQEQEVYINGSDTLHYTYTPLPGQEEEPQAEKRPPFLRRVVKYFEGSTTDRTFEKKIDFTFAGGPSYSKNTSLGIGLLAAGLYRIDRTDSVTAPRTSRSSPMSRSRGSMLWGSRATTSSPATASASTTR